MAAIFSAQRGLTKSGESKIQIINKELRFSTLLLSPIFFFIKKLTTNY